MAAILRYPLPDLDELEEIAAAHETGLEVEEDEEDLTDEMKRQKMEALVREDMEAMGF